MSQRSVSDFIESMREDLGALEDRFDSQLEQIEGLELDVERLKRDVKDLEEAAEDASEDD